MRADIGDADSLRRALDGQEAAYYLVHSLADADFAEQRPRRARTAFAAAATGAGLSQVIYLGGLGDDGDDLSEHLRSRREVESILRGRRADHGAAGRHRDRRRQHQLGDPAPARRAAAGDDHPALGADADPADRPRRRPRRPRRRARAAPTTIGEIYEIGGPEALTYRDMMLIASRVMDRRRLIVPVPLLSPRLSSHWLRLITDVDLTTARALVDSMTNEVVVHDHRIDELLGHTPMTFAAAAAKALAARAERRAAAEARARP